MAVDRGGLHYSIKIEDDFSKPLSDFRSGIAEARDSLRQFKAEASKGSGAGAAVAKDAQQVAKAAKDTADASKVETEQIKKKAKALSTAEIAQKRYAKAVQEAAIAREKARISEAQGFRQEQRGLTTAQARAKAETALTKVLNDRVILQQKLAAVQARGVKLTDQEAKRLGLLTDQQKQLLAAKQRLAAFQASEGNDELNRIRAQTEALRRQQRVQQEEAVKSLLAARGLDASGRKAAPAAKPPVDAKDIDSLKKAKAAFNDLFGTLRSGDQTGNRVFFTFRRLFGIFATFALIRQTIQGFRDLVAEAVNFNRNLETATLGVASLLTAVGQVRDAQGGSVTATRSLSIAQGEARRQINLLRRDALQTIATFEQLAETFQVGIAPGLQAGLNIDQIRKFTVSISQAASAIGLSQNQLAEEIRSILSGTIQQRTTRIAVALGITNEDIRNAKEAGVLVQFLEERFKAFSTAGIEALSTFDGLLNRLKDGISLLLGSAGVGFFEEVKGILKDIVDLTTDTDPITGLITPSPEALTVLRIIFDALRDIVAQARQLRRSFTFGNVAATATVIANSLRVLGAVLLGISQGATKAFGAVATFLTGLGQVVPVDDLTRVASIITQVGFALLAIKGTIGLIRFGISLLSIVTTAWSAAVTIVSGAWTVLNALITITKFLLIEVELPVLIIGAAIIAAAVGLGLMLNHLRKMLSAATGIEIKFLTLLKIIKAGLIKDTKNFIDTMIFGLGFIATKVELTFAKVKKSIASAAIESAKFLVNAFAALPGGASLVAGAQAALGALETETNKALDAQIGLLEKRNTLLAKELIRRRALNDARFNESFKQALDENDTTPTLAELAGNLGQRAADAIKSVLGPLLSKLTPEVKKLLGIQDQIIEAQKLGDVLGQLPAIIGRSTEELEVGSDVIKQLREDLRDINAELRQGLEIIGLSGDVLTARRAAFEGENRIAKENEQLVIRRGQIERELLTTFKEQERLNARIKALAEDRQAVIAQGVQMGRAILDTSNEIAKTESSIALERAKYNDAVEKGLSSQKNEAQNKIDELNTVLAGLNQRLEQQKNIATSLTVGLPTEEANQLNQLISERIRLAGVEVVKQEELQALRNSIIKVENSVNEIINKRLQLLAQEEAFNLRRQNSEASANFANRQAEVLGRDLRSDDRNLIEASVNLRTLIQQTTAARQLRVIEQQNLATLIQQGQARLSGLQTQLSATTNATTRADLERQITQQVATLNDERLSYNERVTLGITLQRTENLELQNAARTLAEARAAIETPIAAGIFDGLKQAALELPTLYQGVVDIIKSTVTDAAATISSTIVDAFDPTTKVDLLARIGQFIKNIGQQVIQLAIQQLFFALISATLGLDVAAQTASASLLLAATGLGEAAGALGLVGVTYTTTVIPGLLSAAAALQTAAIILASVSFFGGGAAHGGRVRDLRRPLGFDQGGRVPNRPVSHAARPRGLDPRDRVPIWARPDEWVIRPEITRLVGHDFMEAFNAGRLDPTALRSLTSVRRTARSARRGQGFAEGGRVGRAVSGQQQVAANSIPTAPLPAFLVANDQAVDMLLRGGPNAVMRFMSDNRDEVRAALGVVG